MRKVVAAWQELDRDNIVFRTAQGREAKRLTTKDRMQTGKVEVNGSKNYLQRLKPNPKQVHQILTAGKNTTEELSACAHWLLALVPY